MSTAHERARHEGIGVSPRVKAAKKVGGEQRRVAGGKQTMSIMIFELFTELPLSPFFFKLLSNFLKKLKISKNESYSICQTLQL